MKCYAICTGGSECLTLLLVQLIICRGRGRDGGRERGRERGREEEGGEGGREGGRERGVTDVAFYKHTQQTRSLVFL